jgi:YD repeat-containing protein
VTYTVPQQHGSVGAGDPVVAATNFGQGRVSKIKSQNVVIDLTYDVRGNVLTEKRTIGGQTYTVTYAYDLADRVTQITYPSGRIVGYARAADGRISGVTTKQNGTAAVVNLASSIVYQPLSRQIKSMVYSNGLNDFNSFTGDGEIDVLGTYNSGVSVINRAHTRTDNQLLTNIFDNVTPANNAVFASEAAGRLQNASGPWGAKTFYAACPGENAQRAKAGDGVGNRTQEISTVGTTTTTDIYGYPSTSNRLTQVTRGTATTERVYDASGNLTCQRALGTIPCDRSYTYNNRNGPEPARMLLHLAGRQAQEIRLRCA